MSDSCTRTLFPSQLEFLGHYEANPSFSLLHAVPGKPESLVTTWAGHFSEFVIGLITGCLMAGCLNRAVTHSETESSGDVFGGRSLRGLFPWRRHFGACERTTSYDISCNIFMVSRTKERSARPTANYKMKDNSVVPTPTWSTWWPGPTSPCAPPMTPPTEPHSPCCPCARGGGRPPRDGNGKRVFPVVLVAVHVIVWACGGAAWHHHRRAQRRRWHCRAARAPRSGSYGHSKL